MHTFIVFLYFLLYHHYLPNNVYLLIFVALDRPELEDQHRHRVRVALAFTYEIKDFVDLVNPCHLFDCCLGPEPSKYVLEKIHQEEKSKIVYFPISRILCSLLALFLLCLTTYFNL